MAQSLCSVAILKALGIRPGLQIMQGLSGEISFRVDVYLDCAGLATEYIALQQPGQALTILRLFFFFLLVLDIFASPCEEICTSSSGRERRQG